MTQKQQSHLDSLSRKHRELDSQITTLQESENFDDMELMRLKHERLKVKDEIFSFKRQLAKDILTQKD
jgi:uncharacterized protein YdcH (DUF465 family)